MLVIVFAFAANAASGLVPPLRDEVTLTALGEKREEASAEEVYLEGYTVDGEQYLAGKDMKILDGKWFWNGERYCWRAETDPRQPEGVTRTVTVGIPVGWDRTLNFSGSVWRGMVEITAGGNTQTVDTYTEDGTPTAVQIGQSESSALVWNQVRYLAVYAFTLLALTGFTVVVMLRTRRDSEWLERSGGKLIYGGVALLAFVLMVKYADSQSLWNDELLRVKVAMSSLKDAMNSLLIQQDASPPLFAVCSHFWYRIAPFGERWLLLICIIPTAGATFLAGVTAERLGGKACGVLASVLLGFSTTVWGYGAYEFSGYAFMIFFTALALYSHVKKSESNEKLRWLIVYSAALTGLAMSHYFGMICCGLLFISDAVMWKKKVTWRTLAAYVAPGMSSLVWLGLVWKTSLRSRVEAGLTGWYSVPTVGSVQDLLRFLTGRLEPTYWLLLIGIGSGIAALAAIRKRFTWSRFYQVLCGGVVTGTLAILFIYGNYVNQKMTLWQGRYFLFLCPFVALGSALGAAELAGVFGDAGTVGPSRRMQIISGFFGIYLALNCITVAPNCGGTQPFRESADWLYTQSGSVFNDDTVIITTIGYDDVWNDYYIARKGRRDPLNTVRQDRVNEDMLRQCNTVYVQYSHMPILEELQNMLNESFTLQNNITNVDIRVYTRNA